VFHFGGLWPKETEEPTAMTAPPLPLLEVLEWWAERSPQPTVFRRFFGARPVVLRAPYGRIVECLPPRAAVAASAAPPNSSLLTRVCEVQIYDGSGPLDLDEVARVLRAAPQLRTFHLNEQLRGKTSWLTTSAVPIGPAFAGLVHPRLRYFWLPNVRLPPVYGDDDKDDEDCAPRLRRICFPRLREMQVNSKKYVVTPAPVAGA
jgi:hypothetical protein